MSKKNEISSEDARTIPTSQDSKRDQGDKRTGSLYPIHTVNFHLVQSCNLRCKYCYSHFSDIKKEDLLSLDQVMDIITELKKFGCNKINFAGGEPFLHPHLGELVRHAKNVGLKTSIVTNATLLSEKWLEQYGQFLDWMGISCDSANESIQKQLGRGNGKHVASTRQAFSLIRNYNGQSSHRIYTKLNSVITRLNWQEDMSDFVKEIGIKRWKIFQMLWIQGENDQAYSELSIDENQFQSFVARHQPLKIHGIRMAAENNDFMIDSYLMIDPKGRFFQNHNHQYRQSDFIGKIGIPEALKQVGYYSLEKFIARGGIYE